MIRHEWVIGHRLILVSSARCLETAVRTLASQSELSRSREEGARVDPEDKGSVEGENAASGLRYNDFAGMIC